MNDPGKVFLEKCFQGFRDFFDMNGSDSPGSNLAKTLPKHMLSINFTKFQSIYPQIYKKTPIMCKLNHHISIA